MINYILKAYFRISPLKMGVAGFGKTSSVSLSALMGKINTKLKIERPEHFNGYITASWPGEQMLCTLQINYKLWKVVAGEIFNLSNTSVSLTKNL